MRNPQEQDLFQAETENYAVMGLSESFADVAVRLHRMEQEMATKEGLAEALKNLATKDDIQAILKRLPDTPKQ